MTGQRSYNKQKRIITAYDKCHRRKQKCNRRRPCNMHTSRKVPDKCLCSHAASSRDNEEDYNYTGTKKRARLDTDEALVDDIPPQDHRDAEDFGCSTTEGNSTQERTTKYPQREPCTLYPFYGMIRALFISSKQRMYPS